MFEQPSFSQSVGPENSFKSHWNRLQLPPPQSFQFTINSLCIIASHRLMAGGKILAFQLGVFHWLFKLINDPHQVNH